LYSLERRKDWLISSSHNYRKIKYEEDRSQNNAATITHQKGIVQFTGPSTKQTKRISRYAKRIRPRQFLIRGLKPLLETTLIRGVQDTGHRTQDTGHRTQDTGHRTQDTGHRTQDTGHRTQNPEPRTQNTEHRTQNTEHRTQNTEHRTQNTEHRTQNTEHRTQNTVPRKDI
jgi:hypothetical protein